MILIVLGKIASGKSLFLNLLSARGFLTLSADCIVHDLYEPGREGAVALGNLLSNEVLDKDGTVNRTKLRDLIFKDELLLKKVNAIIHPMVYAKMCKFLSENVDKNVAIETSYFDVSFFKDFEYKIVWLERSKNLILDTLIKERSFDPELAEMAYDKLAMPAVNDFVIDNSGTIDQLRIELSGLISACEKSF